MVLSVSTTFVRISVTISILSCVPATTSIRPKIPTFGTNESLNVSVGFYLESIGNFKALEMSFDVDMYFRQSWLDPRLAHNDTVRVISDQSEIERIFLPDLYFANARTAHFQTVMTPNVMLYVFSDGTTLHSTRVTLKLACNLDLHYYPMDKQTCKIKLASYAHNTSFMTVNWLKEDTIVLNPEIDLPEFFVTRIETDTCDGTFDYTIPQATRQLTLRGELYHLVGRNICTRFSIGYHLVQSYIPTGLIVIVSWVSFWIDCGAVPARISLSFTTLLTLATQGAGLRFGLPPVSYAKAIDYWFGTCMIFVFGVLLEFAAVNSCMRRAQKFRDAAKDVDAARRYKSVDRRLTLVKQNSTADAIIPLVGGEAAVDGIAQRCMAKTGDDYAFRAHQIDQICRFAFPGVFALFTFSYWMYYMVIVRVF